MPTALVLGAVRTPWGRLLGSLGEMPPPALGAAALREAIRRSGVEASAVERVVLGNVWGHAQRGNPAAAAAAEAGIPVSVPCVTLRAGCASGLLAVLAGVEAILSGKARIVACGGFDSASQAPHLAFGMRRGLRLGGGALLDAARHDGPIAVPVGAEADAGALAAAAAQGAFAEAVLRLDVVAPRRGSPASVVQDDALTPFPPDPGAAGSAPLADGAAIVVLAAAGSPPAVAAARLRPAPPTLNEALEAARRVEADLSAEEAATLASAMPAGRTVPINPSGGGALLGHACGADGARLVVTLVHALRRAGGGAGLALASGGWGERAALLVEV